MDHNGCLKWDDVIQWDGWTREYVRQCCAEIRSRVTTLEVAKHYGMKVNSKGFTRCCFHDEKTASMKIYEGDNGFYCFGCHEGGDTIKLASKLLNLDTVSTIRELNDEYHIGLTLDGRQLSSSEVKAVKQAAEQRRQAEKAAQQLETWRMAAVNRLSSEVQMANNLPPTPDAWTAEQKAALLRREQNEALLDILMGDDIDAIVKLYKGR